METRIKYIKTTNSGWVYAIQVKKWLFWKTIETYASFEGAERFLNTLKEISDFNSKKTKSVNKAVYTGYGVRDIISNGSPDWRLSFFTTYPKKTKRTSSGGIEWVDSCGHALPLISINLPKLFGKEYLEPTKLRITIEQIEE